MRSLFRIRLLMLTLPLALLAACGGNDLSGEMTPMAKILPRTSMEPVQRGQQEVDAEMAALRAAGVIPGKAGCYLRSNWQVAGGFWMIVEIPIEQVQLARQLYFVPLSEARGPDPQGIFFEGACTGF